MLDHRLVQTAVIGHKNSDHPVILPMDAWELDRWRGAHPGYSYWCGLQLGGCGGELSDRRYTTKVCHFAHHSTAPDCHRKNNGESSADHLFIKRGVQRLLAERKVKGEVNTRDLGAGPGDAVDVYLPDGRRRLRFQLGTVDHRSWRRADDELAADADGIDWIFASGGPITRHVLDRHGYCLRVRCETVGGERRVHVGAEGRDRKVSWTPLEDCLLTPTGIVTPHTERIHLSPARPGPVAFPLQSGLVFTPARDVPGPSDSPFAAEGRRLLVADVKPAGSPVVRGLISLPGGIGGPSAPHVYRVTGDARMLVGEGTVGWAVEFKRYERLDERAARRTGLRTTPDTSDPAVPVARAGRPKESQPGRKPEPAHTEVYAPVFGSTAGRPPRTKGELLTAVRDTLARQARQQRTITWEDLVRTVSPELAKYSTAERQDLLVEVDSPLRENVPVLSALLRENGEPLPYLSRVLPRLGVLYSGTSVRIAEWAIVETERAFAAYAVPSRAMQPRLSLMPTKPAARRPAKSTRGKSGSGGTYARIDRAWGLEGKKRGSR
ncbi:hypothetical protein [Streptomyces incanus]|uniref:Uncharacterized protein n=1 Tax=Streptomyces incanus TaxID=887453 RepID=A0ABW0XTA0_9ACTN